MKNNKSAAARFARSDILVAQQYLNEYGSACIIGSAISGQSHLAGQNGAMLSVTGKRLQFVFFLVFFTLISEALAYARFAYGAKWLLLSL